VPANKLCDDTLFFDVLLFEKIKSINVSTLKEPIATVWYDSHANYFVYNYTYSDKINDRLKRQYYSYYSTHRKKIDNLPLLKSIPIIALENKTSTIRILPIEMDARNVVFQVQLLATTGPRKSTCSFFKGYGEVAETFVDGLYKYTAGNCKSLAEARALKTELKQLGFGDAFIVAIKNGNRVPIDQATNLIANR